MTKPRYKKHDPAAPDNEPPAPLKALNGAKPPYPDWFLRALEAKAETGTAEVEGASIAWKAWGERGRPGLVLIHGGVAHKEWWDAIGPFLAEDRRVVALDLTGMGDSGWRDEYRMDLYAAEVRAAGEAGGAFEAGKPLIAGHSFGGFVSLACAMEYGEAISGAVVLDSPVRPPKEQRSSSAPRRGGKIYPSFDYAVGRFRLLPAQPCDNLFLLDHIARHALKPEGEGWTWKFDPQLWPKLVYPRRPPAEMLAALNAPVAFLRGAKSDLVTDEIWSFMRAVFPKAPMLSIPESRHHLILDQPLAVASALGALAAGWG